MKTIVIALCLLLAARASHAKTIRATDMSGALWAELSSGALGDAVVEFHQGDELPVTMSAEGDLIGTTRAATSYVGVKRNFWLKARSANKIQISLDGVVFKDIGDLLTGSLEVGAGSGQAGGRANAINVGFKASLK